MTASTEQESKRPVIRYAAFSLGGLLRFVSHQELLDVFGRALLRSGEPVAYSKGFNPRPRLSLPAPKAVGMACREDILRVNLAEASDPAAFRKRLQDQLPEGLALKRVWDSLVKKYPQVRSVELQIDLSDWAIDDPAERIEAFLQNKQYIVKRRSPKGGREREIDVRSFVDRLEISGRSVIAQLDVAPDGSVRPGELLAALGLPATEGLARIARTNIRWADESFLVGAEAA